MRTLKETIATSKRDSRREVDIGSGVNETDGKYTNSLTILKNVHNERNILLFLSVGW